MKRLFTTTLLSLACFSAYAEWIPFGTADDGSFKTYVDPTTYRRDGHLVKVWVITDFAKPQLFDGVWYSSTKNLQQYNCKEETHRIIFVSFYLKNMAQGNTHETRNQPNATWKPAIPGTTIEGDMIWACGHKP